MTRSVCHFPALGRSPDIFQVAAKALPRVEVDVGQPRHFVLEGDRQAKLLDLCAHGVKVVAAHGNVVEARRGVGLVLRQERQVVVLIARPGWISSSCNPPCPAQPSAALTLDGFSPCGVRMNMGQVLSCPFLPVDQRYSLAGAVSIGATGLTRNLLGFGRPTLCRTPRRPHAVHSP